MSAGKKNEKQHISTSVMICFTYHHIFNDMCLYLCQYAPQMPVTASYDIGMICLHIII